MQLQTTMTQLGNSDAIIVPAPMMREAKYKRGQKFTIDYISQTNSFSVRPVEKSKASAKQSSRASDVEFQKWFDEFIEENGEILDELATR